MPWERKGKCVYKKTKDSKKLGKKQGYSKTVSVAKKYLKALYTSEDEVLEEIKDYFSKKSDDHLEFDSHPLATISDLMDPMKPAPWDNTEDDENVDIDIKEVIKK